MHCPERYRLKNPGTDQYDVAICDVSHCAVASDSIEIDRIVSSVFMCDCTHTIAVRLGELWVYTYKCLYSEIASKHGHILIHSNDSMMPFLFLSGDRSRCPKIFALGYFFR